MRTRVVLGAVALLGVAWLLGDDAPQGTAGPGQSGPCALAAGTAVGPVDRDLHLTPSGTLRGVVLFVDFPDAPADGPPLDEERATTDGVRERLAALTSGQVDLELTPVRRWFRMPEPSTAYAVDTEDYDTDAYIGDALEAADDEVDFAPYDVVYVAAADSADAVTTSHAVVSEPGNALVVDGREVRAQVDLGSAVDDPLDLYVEHETLHLFGLPDLYGPDDDVDRWVGGFDVMGFTVRQPELLAWHRWMLGTVADSRVLCLEPDAEHELLLAPLPSAGEEPVAFVVRTGPSTVLVGEHRTRDGLDEDACRTGLLLYEVDDRRDTGEGPVRVVDSRPGSRPSCGTELDDAPFDAERPSHRHASGVEVTVLGEDGDALRVRVVTR